MHIFIAISSGFCDSMSEVPMDNTDVPVEVIPRVGVTDAERELANNAHVEFESKQYER